MNSIGLPLDRVDGPLKVTGRANYTGDIAVPRMACAALVTSTIANGQVLRLDSRAAERAPGVIAVISHVNAMKLPQDGKGAVQLVAAPVCHHHRIGIDEGHRPHGPHRPGQGRAG